MLGECEQLKDLLKSANNCDGFVFSVERGACVSDNETDTITHKDCNTVLLSSWSIIVHNIIIRNIELKTTLSHVSFGVGMSISFSLKK